MSLGQIVTGQKYKWDLLEKLGEGDAGEVYLVETLLQGKQAILKRPTKSAFISDSLRQASQIQSEASLLKALAKVDFPNAGAGVAIPGLIDQSTPEDGYGERYFIVIEKAAGFDLKSLAQVTHFGLLDQFKTKDNGVYADFLQRMAKFSQLPDQLLIRSFLAVINILETIHTAEVWDNSEKQHGLIWNDVKPDHLFWDPQKACLTVIDWGNGFFLEADGSTSDRQHSRVGDYYQFVQGMGEFLSEANPVLMERLDWPKAITPGNAYTDGIKPLKERLAILNEEVLAQLQELRETASQLYDTSRPGQRQLSRSDELQQQMVAFGELPDSARATNFYARVALQLASDHQFEAFQKICQRVGNLASSSSEKWSLLSEIAGLDVRIDTTLSDSLRQSLPGVLASGIADEWPSVLWDLFDAIGNDPVPDWWESISRSIRRVHLKLDQDALPPSGAVSRLYYTLQAIVLEAGDKNTEPDTIHSPDDNSKTQSLDNLLKIFDSEVVKKWKERQPAPPNSGIGYHEFDGLIDELKAVLPDSGQKIQSALNQSQAQAEIALNAWEHRDFETTRKALRLVLLWDPDRWRLLAADRAIARTSQWLAVVRNGAPKDEPFYDYLSSTELSGRSLRNRVGPASWLDMILDALKKLRKGARSADLMMEHPEIATEIPWLNEFRSREILTLPRSRPLTLERDANSRTSPVTVAGSQEARLGAGHEVALGEPLDTWVPEARGSSARVFSGTMRDRTGHDQQFAIKVMRPDRMEYALPLFREEAHILSLLRDVPGVTPLVECGYLRLEDGAQLPAEDRHLSAEHLNGQVVRFGTEQIQNYLSSMDRYLSQNWVPYLTLELRDHDQNLLKYCDAGITHGWFLPLRTSLLLSIQICDILQIAHDRNIVYRDHKILHYYWDPQTHGVISIDWNIAKQHAEGLTEPERIFDLVQFGARALHHILTGRPAPGSLPLGPNRPDEIEQASANYAVNWTYDDERLPNRVKEILEQLLNQGYNQVRDLRSDLAELFEQLPGPA
jgi:serine/threonine protein kinase